MIHILLLAFLNLLFIGCLTVSEVDDEKIKNEILVNDQLNSSQVEIEKPNRLTLETANNIEELLDDAIRWGDCDFLYEYTQDKNSEKEFIAKAIYTLDKYTNITGSRYQTKKMEKRVRLISPEIQESIFKTPEMTLLQLVSNLTFNVNNEFQKVKIIHDWICDNISYDTEMYFSGRISSQDYLSVLKNQKAVCSGYTNLMNEMCSIANIESIGINGWSKGHRYSGRLEESTDHAWNAVHIGEKWYLIDVTWDAWLSRS